MNSKKVPLIHLSNTVIVDNVGYTLKEASDKFNINLATITNRYKQGHRGNKLIAKRLKKGINKRQIAVNNKLYTWEELSLQYNINISTLQKRYKNGLRDNELIKPTNIKMSNEVVDMNTIRMRIDGYSYTLKEVSEKLKIDIDVLEHKYKKGIRGIDLLV